MRNRRFATAAAVLLSLAVLAACASAPDPEPKESAETRTEEPAPAVAPFGATSTCSEILDVPEGERLETVEGLLVGAYGFSADSDTQTFIDDWCATSGDSLMSTWTAYVEANRERLVYAFENPDGYTYTIDVAVPDGIEVSRDVASQKPGEVELTVSYPITATVENTTEGRDTPYAALGLMPVWSPGSDVCAQVNEQLLLETGYEPNGYCRVGVTELAVLDREPRENGQFGGGRATLRAGETAQLGPTDGSFAPTERASIALVVSEESEERVAEQLRAPAFWALVERQEGSGDGGPGCSTSAGLGTWWTLASTAAGATVCTPS